MYEYIAPVSLLFRHTLYSQYVPLGEPWHGTLMHYSITAKGKARAVFRSRVSVYRQQLQPESHGFKLGRWHYTCSICIETSGQCVTVVLAPNYETKLTPGLNKMCSSRFRAPHWRHAHSRKCAAGGRDHSINSTKPEYVIPYVGNLTKEKSCVNMSEFPTSIRLRGRGIVVG
jgi:hypothetical protein